MNANMVPPVQQQQPDGDGSTGGDNHNFRIGEAKTLTASRSPKSRSADDQSTHNIVSTLFRRSSDDVVTTTSPLELDVEVAYSSPTPFDNDNGNDDYKDNSLKPVSRKLFEQQFAAADSPTYTDVPDDVVTTTTPLTHDRASSSCSTINHDYDDYDDNDNDVLQFLVITKSSKSDEPCLPGDTFSFLIYSPVLRSRTFYLATFVFLFQMFIYGVLAYDITSVLSNKKNRFKIPVNVEIPVRIAEFLALLVAIITQDEVRKAVNLLRDGFDQDLLPKAFPGATKVKWGLSIAARAIEGLFGLLLTCLLIMQSTKVLDLLLNFLAMAFVSQLDDVVFVLTREGFVGFLGRVLQNEAKKVSDTYYHASHRSVESRKASFFTKAYFLVLFILMFGAWGWIVWNQDSGKYLCSKIFAQYGDEALPMLGTFSGLFYLNETSFQRRLSYSYKDDRVGGALLAYCHEQKRWTLSLPEDDPCKWIAASEESVDFDILTTANSQWVVKTASNSVVVRGASNSVPLTQHFMACHECKYNDNFCGEKGEKGECMKDEQRCKCSSGHYGLRCEYADPCRRLEIDQRDIVFVKTGESYFASKYYRLKDGETYNHPVYTSLRDNQTLSDDTDFLVFTGVRWIISYKNLFPELKDVNDVTGLATYFRTRFHGHHSNYSAPYVSEPVYMDTQVDATASPLSVRWRYSALDKDQRLRPDLQKGLIETSFFCAVCNNDSNPCQFGAICQLNGTCGDDCPNGSSGTMCQIPPTSNGLCNPYFNNINFDFDGGDCCENTCRSTPENTCGKAGQGYIDTGYPSCVRASKSNQWELSGDQIHGENSASRSGHSVALSGKGAIIAVADPGVSIVRLFDKEGSRWIERVQVQGPPESNFGLAIGLSHESYNITRNPRTYPTVTLAVGAPKLGLVRVYTCSSNTIVSSDRIGCIQRGKDIVGGGGFGNSLSIAKDGNSIAIGGADRESIVPEKNTSVAIGGAGMDPTGEIIVGDVKVFTWSNHTNDWLQKGNVTLATAWPDRSSALPYQFNLQGYYVSLSGDYLAVGTLEGGVTSMPRFESVNLISQVYKWDESTGWNQLGDEIKKKFYDDASFGDSWPLRSFVIKGSILAIGSNSSVSVYEWTEASSQWTPRQIESEGYEVKGLVGWSVDLSEDANILAVGASVENPQPNDESIRLYKWNGTRYNALFGVPGGPATSVSLSSDGKAVAVGLPFDASRGGSTRVYSFHPSSPCEDPSEDTPLRISFTTDGRPEETSWELRVDSQVKRRSGSLAGFMYTTFVEEMCVPATSCVELIVYDSHGDGLNPPGVFALMLNGTEVFGNETCIAEGIGDCECANAVKK